MPYVCYILWLWYKAFILYLILGSISHIAHRPLSHSLPSFRAGQSKYFVCFLIWMGIQQLYLSATLISPNICLSVFGCLRLPKVSVLLWLLRACVSSITLLRACMQFLQFHGNLSEQLTKVLQWLLDLIGGLVMKISVCVSIHQSFCSKAHNSSLRAAIGTIRGSFQILISRIMIKHLCIQSIQSWLP